MDIDFVSTILKSLEGKKVQCIDDSFVLDPRLPYTPTQINLPKKGVVYTIRGAHETFGGVLAILLVEVINEEFLHHHPKTRSPKMSEPMFKLERFKFI